MRVEELFQNLEHWIPLGPKERLAIGRSVSITTLPAQTGLIINGQVHPWIYFVKKGVLRHFEIRNQKQWTNWFFKKGDLVLSLESFFWQKPARGTLQACTSVELYTIAEQEAKCLLDQHHSLQLLADKLAEAYLKQIAQQVYYATHKTAWQRYQLFVKENPYVAARVQSNHIASFLGILPGSVSRFRKRIATDDARCCQ